MKLLDLGIARLLESEGSTDRRQANTIPALTPLYASPEQLRGDPVTAASDVYSLGLILFELLTGQRAFAAAVGSPGSLREGAHSDPPRASLVVRDPVPHPALDTGSPASDPVQRAALRATSPERLQRRLRGDLDTILDRALRAEPAERYPSAQALADDIRRHLEGLPIHAQRPSRAYRARKFVRRNRAMVASGLVGLVALLGGLAAATWQGVIAARERDEARMQAAKAERVTEFLVNVFTAANPYAPTPERLDTFRVTSLLQRGAARVRRELAGDPAVKVPLLRAIGRSYRLLPDRESAAPLIDSAVALSRAVYGPDHPEFAASITEQAHLLGQRGRFSDAERLFRQALDVHRTSLGEMHPALTRSLSALGGFLLRRGRAAEADSLLGVALVRARTAAPPDSVMLADLLARTALAAGARRDYETALQSAREALAVNRALVGPEHPRSIGDLNNIAIFLQRLERRVEAEVAFREALELQRRALGPAHPNVLSSMVNHAAALDHIGRDEEARQTYAEAVNLAPQVPARTASQVMYYYAGFLRSQDENAEAERWYRQAITKLASASTSEDPELGRFRTSLADLLCATGRTEAGADLFAEALASLSRLLPPDHRDVERARSGLRGCKR